MRFINHDKVSFIKSIIRIVAGIILLKSGLAYGSNYFIWTGALLVAAELLGVVEEVV